MSAFGIKLGSPEWRVVCYLNTKGIPAALVATAHEGQKDGFGPITYLAWLINFVLDSSEYTQEQIEAEIKSGNPAFEAMLLEAFGASRMPAIKEVLTQIYSGSR